MKKPPKVRRLLLTMRPFSKRTAIDNETSSRLADWAQVAVVVLAIVGPSITGIWQLSALVSEVRQQRELIEHRDIRDETDRDKMIEMIGENKKWLINHEGRIIRLESKPNR